MEQRKLYEAIKQVLTKEEVLVDEASRGDADDGSWKQIVLVLNACGWIYDPTGKETAVDEIGDLVDLIKKVKVNSPGTKKMNSLGKDLQKAEKLLKKVVPQIKKLAQVEYKRLRDDD